MSGVLQVSGSVASKSITSHGPRRPGAVLSTPEKVQVKCPQSEQEAPWQPQKIAYCAPIKATMLSAQSPRPYSWWWNSHHSPKNSKWLQENLTDMDDKVRAMLKLIEEDADSFAKRAEMYYKKRPELVKLVEEFYRAYRALVERYDHISGELRQVHYIIAEALPNQTQGDFPYTSLLAWTNEQSFESPQKIKSFINADIMPKSSFRQQVASPVEMHSKAVFSPNGTDDASEMSKSQGLKQLNEIITQYKTLEKKVLQLQEDLNHVEEEKRKMKEGSSSEFKQINSLKEQLFSLKRQNKELDKEGQVLRLKLQAENVENQNLRTEIQNFEVGLQNSKQGSVEKGIQCEDVSLEKGTRDDEISSYQDELYQLQKENNRLSALVMRGVQQLEEVGEETQNLYQALSKSRAEQETLFLQYENSINLFQTSENRAKDLQVGLTLLQEENNKLKDEVTAGASHLKVMEEKAHNLERDKKVVQQEMEHIIQKTNSLIEELTCVRNEEQNLRTRLQDETAESRKIDIALKNCQKALNQSQEQQNMLTAEIQVSAERVKDGERKISVLEGEISQLENQIGSMVEQTASASMTIKNLEEEVSKLKQEKSDLLNEVAFRVDQRNALQQELYCLQEERNDLDRRFQTIEKQHNKLQLRSQDLEKEKLLLITESEQHNKQRKMLETNLHDCQNRLSELERENLDLSSKLKNSLEHIDSLNGQLHFVQKEKEKSEHEIKACNAHISDLKMQVSLLEEEGNDLRSKMQEETEKQEKAHVEIGRLQQLLDQMQERNIELSDECRQHIGELTTVKEKVTDLERDIRTQKMENISLANNLSLGVKFKDQLKVRIYSLKNLLAVPDIGVGQLQGEDVEGMWLFDAIIEKVKIMQTDLSCVEEANKRLSNVSSAMSTYVEQLKSDMSLLQSEKNSLEEDVVIRSWHSENLQKELFMVQDAAETLRIQLQATKEREGNLEEEAKKLQHSLERSENAKMILQNEYQRTLYNYNSVKTQVAELQCRFCVVEQESQTFLTEVLTQISLMTILESNIAERNEQIQQLVVLLKRLVKEKKELEDEVQTGSRKFQVLEAEVEHLQEVVQKFEEEKRLADALQNELKLLNEKCEQMGLKLEIHSHLNKEKDTMLANVRQRLQAVEEENITLVKDVENMKGEHAAGEMTLKNLRLQVSSMNEEIIYLRQAESNLEEDVKNLQHSLLSSHDAHLLLQDEHQRTLQDYNSVRTEIDELKGRFCAVEQENMMFLTEALTQMNLLTVLKSNVVQKDEQVQQLFEQLNKSHTEKVELESKVQIGAGKLQMLEVEVQKLQDLTQRFKEEKSIADTLQNELKLLNMKFEQMNLQLQSGFYLLKEKDKMLCELREQLQSVDEEKKKMLKDLVSAQEKHAISEMAANEFWLQVSSLKEENIHLRQELLAAEKDKAKVKEELHDSCKEREILSMKLTSSAIKEEKLQIDIKQLQEEREDLRCQLQKQTEQATMIESEVEGLHETLKFKEIHNVLLKDGNQKIYNTCKLLGTQTQDLKEKIISMEHEKKKQGAEAEARVAQVKELERTIADLETGKHNAGARAATILSLTAPLKDDLYGLKEQVLGQMTILKMDTCKLQDNMLKYVKDAMNKLQETNMDLSLEVQSQAHEVQKLQAEIKHIVTEKEKKNQTLEDEYHRIIKENHDVKAKLEDVLNVKIHLESENSSLKMELNEHIQKAAQLEERRETIEDELHFQVKEGENLKAQLEETKELRMHILKLLEFVIGPDPNQVSLNVESCQFAKNKLNEIHEEMFCLKHENKKLKEDTLHMSCQIDKLKAALSSKYKEGIIDGRVRSHRLSRNSQRKTQQIEAENWTPDGEIPKEPKNKYLTLEIGSKREDGVFGKERTFLEKPQIKVADSHVYKDKGLLQMQESVHGTKVSKNDPNNDALDKSDLFQEKYTDLGNPVQELSGKAKKLDAKSQAEQDLSMKLKQLQPELVDTKILKERIEELQAHVKSLQLENIQFKELSHSKEADLVEVESLTVQEEKEVVVDEAKGPENPNDVIQEIDMFQEENKKNWGRLDFATKKVQSLQNAIQELQRRSKSLKQKNKSLKDDRWKKGLDYNSLEKQLRELQGQAKQLSEHNNRLRKDVKYVFACMNRIQEDISGQENKFDEETLRACQQNSKIAERLDSSSEKVRVLELEVQRIRLTLSRFQQQILEDGPKIKVPLRAFLVGGRKEPPLKQKACCACMHPSTRD